MSTVPLQAFDNHLDMIEVMKVNKIYLRDLVKEIQDTYLADDRAWIIGYSGGKDSTAVVSLIYSAMLLLPEKKRSKPIYVVSSDTLVETPVVVDLIKSVLLDLNIQAGKDKIPLTAHPVYPKADQTFWTNLLGRGYPAPRQKFRWCTERMKIDPVSEFIQEKVSTHGEAIVVLGARSDESASRAQVIANHEIKDPALSRHSSLANAYTYMPIKSWSADNVWDYLLTAPTPWNTDNNKLFELYKGSNQGECPLVIDTSTPSCGNSRFGCWTCTVVTKDKAIHGLVESGETWMQPLLDFRNQLFESTKPEKKKEYRNSKRRTGKVTYSKYSLQDDNSSERKHIPGPYWMSVRQSWLKDLLEMQKVINNNGHELDLITIPELQAIRQHWIRDPNEPDWTDALPRIYAEVYPDSDIEWVENDAGAFTEPDAKLLEELGRPEGIPAEMIMKLIEVELSTTGLAKRRGIIGRLESVLKKDWDSLEEVKERSDEDHAKISTWDEELENLQTRHSADFSL